MKKKNSLLVIIPAYNEEESITLVVNELKSLCAYNIDYIVVNDGSTDKTYDICLKDGYPVLDLPMNLGLAGAFQAGMKYAYKKGYSYAIQVDVDGQHPINAIPCMLNYIIDNKCDVLIASRFLQGKKNWSVREIGSRMISLCIKLVTGKKISDPTSGMRMYSADMIKKLATQMDFNPEPDMLVEVIKQGYNIEEFPVVMSERKAGKSYLGALSSLKYMFYICSSIVFVHWFR